MKVELVSKTQGVGKYESLDNEQIIAAIARHGVIKDDNGKLVKYLMDNKHWSPLDMINFTFEIETSRAIGRQLLRHKINPQEHSQRYSDRVLFEEIELRLEDSVNRQSSTEVVGGVHPDKAITVQSKYLDLANKMNKILNDIREVYREGIELGVAKECMRFILPETTTTTMTFNGTLRSWLSFLNVRMDHHTQKEAKEIAELIGEELERQLPNIFGKIDWRNGMFM